LPSADVGKTYKPRAINGSARSLKLLGVVTVGSGDTARFSGMGLEHHAMDATI
jgi:hypothetical protein